MKALYRSLAGHLCRAKIIGARPDGTVDIDVDAGCKDRVHLSRIRLCAAATEPGTCALEGSEGLNGSADQSNDPTAKVSRTRPRRMAKNTGA